MLLELVAEEETNLLEGAIVDVLGTEDSVELEPRVNFVLDRFCLQAQLQWTRYKLGWSADELWQGLGRKRFRNLQWQKRLKNRQGRRIYVYGLVWV